MLKRIRAIFYRDMKVNIRDAIAIMILVFPLVLAVGINIITPEINDTTINVAMVRGEDETRAQYFDSFAHVSLLDSEQAVEERVLQRDDVIGIVNTAGGYSVLVQGNESAYTVDYAKLINALYESGAKPEDAGAKLVDFGRTTPPLKKMMVNALLLLVAVMAGMLISLNIVEEKSDRTISAMNVSPVSRSAFILGKSLIGIVFALVSSALCIIITGFYDINIFQAIIVLLAVTVLSMTVGFVQGINSNDVMEAAGSVKLMFLPLAGSIVGYELVKGGWQAFFYWSPFYWAYRANDMILSGTGGWPEILLCAGILIAVCAGVYAILAPRIRKGLQ